MAESRGFIIDLWGREERNGSILSAKQAVMLIFDYLVTLADMG